MRGLSCAEYFLYILLVFSVSCYSRWVRVWINVLQRYSSSLLGFGFLFLSQIYPKTENYHTANHTRLFLVSSLEKLNYRRRSIRLFALLLDATAHWHHIICSHRECMRPCVGLCVRAINRRWRSRYMVRLHAAHVPHYTRFFIPDRVVSVDRSVLFVVCCALLFGVLFVLFVYSFAVSFTTHTHACHRRTDRQTKLIAPVSTWYSPLSSTTCASCWRAYV